MWVKREIILMRFFAPARCVPESSLLANYLPPALSVVNITVGKQFLKGRGKGHCIPVEAGATLCVS